MSLAEKDGTPARARKGRRVAMTRAQADAHRDHILDHLFRRGIPDPTDPTVRRAYTPPELALIFRVDPTTVRRSLLRHALQAAAIRRAAR